MSVLNLLVVDDEPGIRSGTERVMRNFSVSYPFLDDDFTYEILTAESGEQALEIIDGTPVDIILLDNKLPGIDGIEVLEYIREKKYDAAVMMITSYASLDLAVKATTMGAHSFMPKPFTPQELRTAVEGITKNLFLKRMTSQMSREGRESQFQFLSVLSHELKSPINAVEGYVRIILDKQAGDSVEDYRGMLERCMERLKGMRALITDLIDLTKIEAGQKNRHVTNIDLHEVAKSVIDTVEPMARQKSVKIHADIPENCFIRADRSEMEIILSNLVSNAIKYNHDKGEVFISISRTDNIWRIIVEDTGIGINTEDQGKLFEDFVRIRTSETKNISGSGLGLSIARKMIDLYGGNITVESAPGKGSKFTVTIPS
ncbi:MAG: hybrid sensor histidine kinase/response regulator [Bacteroidales bacterium]|jgi:signal transduction histidine kinase|nr:hybrid sensor histidine kinase/response regulator [Bacteroidales bacterium]MCB9027977.1 hybrid sensor histidine kinase/response regulator [Bacteroidales bacterium]HRW26786.1 hybrid sensor histidine kinase/response regulator [Bacteroidales bacterium]